MVSNKPGHRGEREVSRKTIARGMPGRSGVTVVTMLVCLFYFAGEAAGASSARHSLRPLISGDRTFLANLARSLRRDREAVSGNGTAATVDNSRNTGADIRHPHRYINPARHVRAFGVWIGIANDGIDTVERRPRRAPQAAVVSLLASPHPRDGSHSPPLCRRRERQPRRCRT